MPVPVPASPTNTPSIPQANVSGEESVSPEKVQEENKSEPVHVQKKSGGLIAFIVAFLLVGVVAAMAYVYVVFLSGPKTPYEIFQKVAQNSKNVTSVHAIGNLNLGFSQENTFFGTQTKEEVTGKVTFDFMSDDTLPLPHMIGTIDADVQVENAGESQRIKTSLGIRTFEENLFLKITLDPELLETMMSGAPADFQDVFDSWIEINPQELIDLMNEEMAGLGGEVQQSFASSTEEQRRNQAIMQEEMDKVFNTEESQALIDRMFVIKGDEIRDTVSTVHLSFEPSKEDLKLVMKKMAQSVTAYAVRIQEEQGKDLFAKSGIREGQIAPAIDIMLESKDGDIILDALEKNLIVDIYIDKEQWLVHELSFALSVDGSSLEEGNTDSLTVAMDVHYTDYNKPVIVSKPEGKIISLVDIIKKSLEGVQRKGQDAMIRSYVNNQRAQAELYYDDNRQSYKGLCLNESVTDMIQSIEDETEAESSVYCNASQREWILEADFVSEPTYYCVDSTGYAGIQITKEKQGALSCSKANIQKIPASTSKSSSASSQNPIAIDAMIKSRINNTRAQAELYYDDNSDTKTYGTYGIPVEVSNAGCHSEDTFFGDTTASYSVAPTIKELEDLMSGKGEVLCGIGVDGDSWALSASLAQGGNYCVDSSGYAKAGDVIATGGGTSRASCLAWIEE